MKHFAIYLPGLNDHKTGSMLTRVLKIWRVFGVDVLYHPMLWSDKQTLSKKLESILKDVDMLISSGGKVSIIGTSAGASAAINTYTERRDNIYKVVCICGKLKNSEDISNTFIEYPAFEESMKKLSENIPLLDKQELNKILSLRSLLDGTVPPSDTVITGANNRLKLAIGHGYSITYALTIEAWRIARFIKS
jgi:hypothetical protein